MRAAEFVLNLADVSLNSILITSDREHFSGRANAAGKGSDIVFENFIRAPDGLTCG